MMKLLAQIKGNIFAPFTTEAGKSGEGNLLGALRNQKLENMIRETTVKIFLCNLLIGMVKQFKRRVGGKILYWWENIFPVGSK